MTARRTSLSIKMLFTFMGVFATLTAVTLTFQYRGMRAAMYEAEEASASNILAPARGKSLRVLVAEDNAVNSKLASSILQRAGHNAILDVNGREAVDAVERERFDVVLMDVQMPVMGGFEATRLICELEAGSGRRTPIIAVTAHAMKGDREACFEAGTDGFAPKLFLEDLEPRVTEITAAVTERDAAGRA